MVAKRTHHDFQVLVLCQMLLVLGSRAISSSDVTVFHNTDIWTEITKYVLSALVLDSSSESEVKSNLRPFLLWVFHFQTSPAPFTLVRLSSQDIRGYFQQTG